MSFDRAAFARTVSADFSRRRKSAEFAAHSDGLTASGLVEGRALGHPDYESLEVGQRGTTPMVAAFLDLSDFTGRSFWEPQDQVVDLAHAVLSGFIETVVQFGGHPLGLRGDGLFAGFTPQGGQDPRFTAALALSACAFALDAVREGVNPWLDDQGIERVRARAGLDFGDITFVRSGSRERSEINPLGFAANFAAKCEKRAGAWEIVLGQNLAALLPDYPHFARLEGPRSFTHHGERKLYHFYDFDWEKVVPALPGVPVELGGVPAELVSIELGSQR